MLYLAGPGDVILPKYKPFFSVPNLVTGTSKELRILYLPTPGTPFPSSLVSDNFIFVLNQG